MQFKPRNIRAIAEMVIGNANHFPYRSSSFITEFFQECDLEFVHDGSTRWAWAASRLEELLAEPQPIAHALPERFMTVLRTLMLKSDATDEDPSRMNALAALNVPLMREGFEAYYGDDDHLYVRHIASRIVSSTASPHRPLTPAEIKRRDQLAAYLDTCSEDELIEEVLQPMFPATRLPSHHGRRSQGQGSGVRQGCLDAVHAPDPTCPLLRIFKPRRGRSMPRDEP